MKKSIEWRINHAKRKIEEGKKISRYTRLLRNFQEMRMHELREGFNYVHSKAISMWKGEKGNQVKVVISPQKYTKVK